MHHTDPVTIQYCFQPMGNRDYSTRLELVSYFTLDDSIRSNKKSNTINNDDNTVVYSQIKMTYAHANVC